MACINNTPQTYFTTYQRNDESIQVTLRDSEGAVIDATGGSILFIAKRNRSDLDADALIAKPLTATDPANGLFTLELADTDLDIDHGTWPAEMNYTDTDGKITTLIEDNYSLAQIVVLEKLEDD